ncbi:MAG TPA: DUF6518 family protein [Thermoleophilaceae bacterium]
MRTGPRTQHFPWRPVLLALIAALGLGVAGRVAVHAGAGLPHGQAIAAVGHTAVALGAPWLAVAWLVGAMAGSRLLGAAGGAGALVLATGGWYLLTIVAAAGGWAAASYAVPMAAAWGTVALGAGALFGFAGAHWRDGDRIARSASAALLSGALTGEALLLMHDWVGRAAACVLSAELSVGLAVLVVSRRRAPLSVTLPLFALATAAVIGSEGGVRDALRLAGWAGP